MDLKLLSLWSVYDWTIATLHFPFSKLLEFIYLYVKINFGSEVFVSVVIIWLNCCYFTFFFFEFTWIYWSLWFWLINFGVSLIYIPCTWVVSLFFWIFLINCYSVCMCVNNLDWQQFHDKSEKGLFSSVWKTVIISISLCICPLFS